jgi:hypothetical protein
MALRLFPKDTNYSFLFGILAKNESDQTPNATPNISLKKLRIKM